MPPLKTSDLERQVDALVNRSVVPYSGRPEAAAVLLSDGAWVPGVRIETASFSLLVDAVVNAVTTAVAADRRDIIAVVLSGPASEAQACYLSELPFASLEQANDRTFTATPYALPSSLRLLEPFLDGEDVTSPDRGVQLARSLFTRSYCPVSNYPVTCVARVSDGRLIPGVNVEHPDWTRILCAERNAIGTSVSYGIGPIDRFFLACEHDPRGTPCGACRQVISELAPDSSIVMDRGQSEPEETTADDLLPGSFSGSAILNHLPDSR